MAVLLSHLPQSSAFAESHANDVEYAEFMASLPPGSPSPPKVSQWSAELEQLAQLTDRLSELIALVHALGGGKAKPPQPVMRPVTEVDRARERAADRRHLSLVAEVKEAQQRYEAHKSC